MTTHQHTDPPPSSASSSADNPTHDLVDELADGHLVVGRHRRPAARRHRGPVAGGAIATACAAAVAAGLVVLGASVTTHAATGERDGRSAVPAPPTAHPFTLAPPAAGELAARPVPAKVRQLATGPGRVYVPALGIDAPWVHAGFSFTRGLDVPADVHTLGLSTQGGQPDDTDGTVLLAGHVNYAGQGAGSLETLSRIRPGAAVVVTDTTGRRTTWIVVSLAAVVKRDLPRSLFTPTGARRLVLITCGGPLHAGNYRDNIVVTALPARTSTSTSTSRSTPPTTAPPTTTPSAVPPTGTGSSPALAGSR